MINEGGIKVNADSSCLMPMGTVFSIMSKHVNGRIYCADYHRGIMATEKSDIITMTLLNDKFDKHKNFRLKKYGEQPEITVYTSESILPFSRFDKKTATAVVNEEMYIIDVPPHSIAVV